MTSYRTISLSSALALGLMTAAAFAGPAADLLPAAARDSGKVVVGIESSYPPMAFRDTATNERAGVNVELFLAMAKAMGVEVQWEEMSFEQLMTSLDAGRIDVIGTAISDLPSRREKMTFVDYIATGAQPFTVTAKAGDFKAQTDLCGRNIGAPRTTNYMPVAEAWSAETCVGDLKPAKVTGTAGATATRLDLMQGRLDVGVLGREYVAYLMQQEPGAFALAGEPLTKGYFGFAVKRDQTEMRDAIVAAVDEVIANGSYAEILKKYGVDSQSMTKALVDSAE